MPILGISEGKIPECISKMESTAISIRRTVNTLDILFHFPRIKDKNTIPDKIKQIAVFIFIVT
jgi:hypothetical protein